MTRMKWCALLAAALVAALAAGCGEDVSEDDLQDAYAGIWRGVTCGRGLTLTLVQSGLDLSGTCELTDPDFSEPVAGSVSSLHPPSTVTLTALEGRKFEITFTSYDSLVGTFHNPGPVCNVNATK